MLNDIFFIHVPKCQGTTLNGLLAAPYSAEQCVTSEQLDTFSILFTDANQISHYNYIGGHYPNWLHGAKFPNKDRMLVVRDPLKRFKSLLKHGHRDVAFRGNLPELWRSNKPLSVFKNKEKLAAWINGSSVAGYCSSSDLSRFTSVEAFYADTMDQIKQFEYLISDLDFNDYFLDLAFKLNMPPLEDVPNMRASKMYAGQDVPVTKGLDEASLKKYIPGEYELYEHVVEASAAAKPTRPNYDRWQAKYHKYWRNQKKSDFFCFTADMPFKGYGWYPRSNFDLKDKGVKYKYGLKFDPSGAFMDIPLDPQMKSLGGVLFSVDPVLMQYFKVAVNGVPAVLNWPVSSMHKLHFFSIELGAEHVGAPYSRIEFSYDGPDLPPGDVFLLEMLAH